MSMLRSMISVMTTKLFLMLLTYTCQHPLVGSQGCGPQFPQTDAATHQLYGKGKFKVVFDGPNDLSEVNQTTAPAEGHHILIPTAPKIPYQDPRDTHLEETMSKETQEARAIMVNFRDQLLKNRYFFAHGWQMKKVLLALGATEESIEEMRRLANNLNHDPHLEFRKTALGRVGTNLDNGVCMRLKREPFVLSAEEGFKRHDAGLLRFFGEPQAYVFSNSAYQATMKFKAFMMDGVPTTPRKGCDINRQWNTASFQIRTVTTPDILGEPAAEGIHQDGVEFTMTTLLNADNMRGDSGFSTIWENIPEQIGLQVADANPDHIIETVQHREFLDTLLILDNDVQHSVTPLYPDDSTKNAYRDMLILFSRHMADKNGQFSARDFDSDAQHPSMPAVWSAQHPVLKDLYTGKLSQL